jgi:hypothetical protein
MRRKLIILGLVLLVVYFASYSGLTLCGRYIPCTFGSNGIKEWVWAPCGFAYKNGRFPTPVGWIFFPLWRCDIHFWHNDWTGRSGPRHSANPPPPEGSALAGECSFGLEKRIGRGMLVRGMGEKKLRFIPLPNIPLPDLPFHASANKCVCPHFPA